MKREEILINATPTEVRAALVDSGVLQEVQIERASRVGLVSNIYKGRVSRVLPGMQAAFIEIGLERTAFLHASDIAVNPHADPPPADVLPEPVPLRRIHDARAANPAGHPTGDWTTRMP